MRIKRKEWIQATWELGQNLAPGGCEGERGSGINLNNWRKDKDKRRTVQV